MQARARTNQDKGEQPRAISKRNKIEANRTKERS
jgi:hypothetical protein